MDYSDEDILNAAKKIVAKTFNVSINTISLDYEFGNELKNSFISDFKWNEYDDILEYIRDAADSCILKELNSGDVVIRTVDDFCKHMIRCYHINKKKVVKILEI
jgi:hypothetical protein